MNVNMTTEDQVRILSTITNKDEAGRHFSERYHWDTLDQLEANGLIAIDRPIHEGTGRVYSEQYWTLEVTPEGAELVEANPEYWDTTVAG